MSRELRTENGRNMLSLKQVSRYRRVSELGIEWRGNLDLNAPQCHDFFQSIGAQAEAKWTLDLSKAGAN